MMGKGNTRKLVMLPFFAAPENVSVACDSDPNLLKY
jgi:hypothetical protein